MLPGCIPELEGVLEIGPVIGEGTFSTVYKGRLLPKCDVEDVPKVLAIKCITPIVEPQILENELRCLTLLDGKDNVVPLLFASRHKDRLALVMPYFEHERFNRLVRRFKSNHIREYMYQLFLAMNHIHSHNIIHRDVKPNNFLYSTKTKKCALVDFGLAQTVDQCSKHHLRKTKETEEVRTPLEDVTITNVNRPSACGARTSLCDKPKKRKTEDNGGRQCRCNCRGQAKVCRDCIGTPMIHAARAGTAGYRPPEVLLKCTEQTTAVDMWACGVILLSILSGKTNFFNAPDDLSNLLQLVTLFGKDALCTAATNMGKNLIVDIPSNGKQPTLKEICETLRASTNLKGFRSSKRDGSGIFPDSAYDLLEKLLTISPNERISASEALRHPFIANRSTEQESFNMSTTTL